MCKSITFAPYDDQAYIRKKGCHFKVAEKSWCMGISVLPDQGIGMAGFILLGGEVTGRLNMQ
jgi:hypothetical protein